jgi:3',5'-cyclic AMP phosphodiesterase CpdA
MAPALRAAAKDADPHLWALLADTHLPADRTKVHQGISMVAHFQAVTKELLALPRRPAGILIAGDLALSSGEAGDYATLRELLRPLSAARYPVHLALGNHDHRERFLDALTEGTAAQRPVATHLVSVVPGWRANWFLLDSLEQTLSTPGRLGDVQLNWLAEALDRHADKPAIVVLHHNLDAKNGVFSLKDAPDLFEVIRPRRQVKACVFGHTHVWRTWTDESGIHCINLPPVAYVFQPADPAGWVQATLRRDGVKLKLCCVNPKHPSQGQVVDLAWRAA